MYYQKEREIEIERSMSIKIRIMLLEVGRKKETSPEKYSGNAKGGVGEEKKWRKEKGAREKMFKVNRGGKQDSILFREFTNKQVDKNCKIVISNMSFIFTLQSFW